MLKFLRTYQKLFFLLTTAAVVVTFCFFGTYSTIEKTEVKPDQKVATSVTGSPLMQSEVDALSYLLALDADSDLYARNGLLLNNRIIAENFLENNLAHLLIEKYFEELKPALAKIFEQAKKYKTYEHSQQPAISQMKIYEQFYPKMSHLLSQLKYEKEFSLNGFDLLTKLYLAQKTFSPYALKRFLLFQQSQYPQVQRDPYIFQNDMLLFNFRDFKDWFSKDFLDLIAQFMLNTAEIAQQKGFSVSKKQAKQDLNLQLFKNYQKKQGSDQLSAEQLAADQLAEVPSDFYKMQLRFLGLEEDSLIKAWQKIMLFNQYLKAVGSAAVLDPVLFKDMSDFTQEKVTVALYTPQKALSAVQNITDYQALKIYLNAVYGANQLKPQLVLQDIKQIQKNRPELIFQTFKIELQKINMEDLIVKIGEKELWDWQTQKKNFSLLQNEFAFLASNDANPSLSADDIFRFLESLNPTLRLQVDAFSRQQMVIHDDEMVKKALSSTPKQKQIITLPGKGGKNIVQGLDNSQLLALLQKACQNDLQAQKKLSFLTADQNIHYSIAVKDKLQTGVFTFEDALLKSSLKKIAEKEVENFKNKQEEIEFIKNLKKTYVQQIRSQIINFGSEENVLKENQHSEDNLQKLKDQFKLKKEIKTISRSSEDDFLKKQIFTENQISKVFKVQDDLSFFVFLKKENVKDEKSLENLQKKLQQEAVLNAAKNILEQIKTKKAYALPLVRIVDEN